MDRSNNAKQIIITIIVVVVIVILLIIGIRIMFSVFQNIFSAPRRAPSVSTQVTLEEGTERLDTVKEPADSFSGTVKFTATVERIVGVRAFVIKNNDLWKNEMLIITDDGIAPIGARSVDEFLIKPGDRLLISGTLIEFNTDNLKADLKEDRTVNLTTWNGKPAIFARDLKRIQ